MSDAKVVPVNEHEMCEGMPRQSGRGRQNTPFPQQDIAQINIEGFFPVIRLRPVKVSGYAGSSHHQYPARYVSDFAAVFGPRPARANEGI